MNIQEVTDLLEIRYKTAVEDIGDKFVYLPVEDAKRILDFLKQQPIAGEFTKEVRSMLLDVALEAGGTEYMTKPFKDLLKACDIIDSAEARNKDLLEECKAAAAFLKGSHIEKDRQMATLLYAAIDKEKRGG